MMPYKTYTMKKPSSCSGLTCVIMDARLHYIFPEIPIIVAITPAALKRATSRTPEKIGDDEKCHLMAFFAHKALEQHKITPCGPGMWAKTYLENQKNRDKIVDLLFACDCESESFTLLVSGVDEISEEERHKLFDDFEQIRKEAMHQYKNDYLN